nr:S16 family serine protease [uncultured Treponema sp.]
MPAANIRDLEKIPEHVKKGIQFHPVTRMEEVIQHSFAHPF